MYSPECTITPQSLKVQWQLEYMLVYSFPTSIHSSDELSKVHAFGL